MTNSTRIAYYRVSTTDQSIESQRSVMGGGFAMEFKDEGDAREAMSRALGGVRRLTPASRAWDWGTSRPWWL